MGSSTSLVTRRPAPTQCDRPRPGIRLLTVGDETELIGRLRDGDEEAFASVVRQHHASLVRLATAMVGSRAVADEVVQDTWLAVVRGVERFEGRSSFKTWLFHILVNRARTTVGRERRSQPIAIDTDDARFDATGAWATPPVPWSETVDDRLVAESLAPAARRMIDELPDSQRQVLILRDVEGLGAGDVAALLGVSEGNVRVLLHRARGKVRDGLDAMVGRP